MTLLKITTILIAAHLASATAIADTTNILFLAGDRSHGSGDHEFNAGCRLLAKALNEQSDLDVKATVINGWPEDESVFEGVDATIIYSDATKVVSKGWEKTDQLVKSGMGIMFMHYAVHPSQQDGEKYFRPWIGGAFESGFSVNPHWVADLKTLPDHPISNGVKGTPTAYDEFYYNMRFKKDRGQVLDLVTAVPTKERLKKIINLWTQEGYEGIDKPQTLMWGIEREDGGRGIGYTGGHYHRNWAIDGVRQIVLNAIVWVAGMDVPKSGVSSLSVTEDQLNLNLDDYGKPNPRITIPTTEEVMALSPNPWTSPEDHAAAQKARKKKPQAKPSKPQATASTSSKEKSTALYESPVLKSSDKQRLHEFNVGLEDGKELFLVVSDEGNRSHDWSNWIAPIIEFTDGTTQPLSELKWESAKSTGTTRVDKNHKDNPLTVGGKIHEEGIGTHAPSVIHYVLPKSAKGISGKVALDDGGAIRDGKSTPAQVSFAIYNSAPPSHASAATSKPATPGITFDPKNLDPQKVPIEIIQVPEDLEVTVWATSPMLFNPTNMDTDAAGRIWVTEGVNYRRHAGRRPEGDRVVILEDTNGDGQADSTHTFIQDPELEAPLGIAVLDNKIYVSQPPHLIVYTDVDRNLVFDPNIDTRENLLSGFNGRQHDHSLHAVVAGPDGNLYFNHGNTGAMFADKDGKYFRVGGPYSGGGGSNVHSNPELGGQVSDDGRVWTGGFAARMNRDGSGVTIIGHGFRNAYEHCLTSFGDVFQNDNDDPPACRTTWLMEGGFLGFFSRDGKRTWQSDQRPGQSIPVAHWRQDNPGTLPPGDVYGAGSPTGIAYYENGALPEKYNGLLLSCEARAQTIFGYYPKAEGAGYTLERFDFFKATEGNMFRPSDVMVGADGAIYISDWFDAGVGGHADRDESLSGTIYRVAPKGFTPDIPKSKEGAAGAVALLSNPSPNVRDTGFVALQEMGADMLPSLKPLQESSNPYLRARAAWLLPFGGEKGVAQAKQLLNSKDANDRLLAYRILRNAKYDFDADTMSLLVTDPSPAVRREIAVSLRYTDASTKKEWVAALLKQLPDDDRTYLEACGLAAEGAEGEIWKILYEDLGAPTAAEWTDSFAWITWRLQPGAAVPALVERINNQSLTEEQQQRALDTIAFTRTANAADAMARLAADGNGKAKIWLFARAWGEWSEFGIQDKLKELGIYDPDNVTIMESRIPPAPEKSNLPPIADIMKLTGDPNKGELLASRCYACHRVGNNGVDYGPDLRNWVADQGEEPFYRAVITPSAGIAHGFSGASVKLKDGRYIHGLAYNRTDPVIVKSMGGLTQFIPGEQVEKVAKLKGSLMLSADQLGFTAQELADLAAFLKTY